MNRHKIINPEANRSAIPENSIFKARFNCRSAPASSEKVINELITGLNTVEMTCALVLFIVE
jgi:hypothetical protein